MTAANLTLGKGSEVLLAKLFWTKAKGKTFLMISDDFWHKIGLFLTFSFQKVCVGLKLT